MRAYRAVFSARFRLLLQYRSSAYAGMVTQIFWGLIRVAIFSAFYHSTSAKQAIPLPDMITYLWIVQGTIALTLGNVDKDVRQMIKDGTIAYELVRPLDLYGYWYSRAVANLLTPTFLRFIPLSIIALTFFGMRLPASSLSALCWLLVTLTAFLMTASLVTFVTAFLLYTISAEGIMRIIPTITYAFSGMLIPIPLMPIWAQKICNFLPFAGMMDRPIRFYIGNLPPSAVFGAIGHQLLWLAILVISGRALLRRATRRIVVQGG